MSTELLHGQMTIVDENGNMTILHQETSASDVLVNRTNNTTGVNGGSSIPSDVDTLQKLTDRMGSLSFKSKVGSSDLDTSVIVNDYNTTEEGHVLDARRGKDLNDRIETIEESEYVYIEDSEDDEVVLPESEINDNIISETLTWSSDKINDELNNVKHLIDVLDITQNLYVTLNNDGYSNYTTEVSVEEIESAYQKGKAIWVMASAILLPLRRRVSASEWIFSGYISNNTTIQAYDITVSSNNVTFTYHDILTKAIINGIQTEYDEETNTVSVI